MVIELGSAGDAVALAKNFPVVSLAQANAALTRPGSRPLFSPDMLPRNPTGKILKSELKRLFAEQAR